MSASASTSRSSSPKPAAPKQSKVEKVTEGSSDSEDQHDDNAGDDNDDDDEVWDPAADSHPRPELLSNSDSKDESTSSTTQRDSAGGSNDPAAAASSATVVASSTDWQAIYSPAHGAYYFFNPKTQETTWTNPLVPPTGAEAAPSQNPSSDPSTAAQTKTAPNASASTSYPQPHSYTQPQQQRPLRPLPTANKATPADELNGIDPELAFLDPSLAGSSSGGPGGAIPTFTAKFNAHTGRFASGAAAARDPNHVSEYERAKRMSEAYFDVDAWKQQVDDRDGARKREREAEEQYGYGYGEDEGGVGRKSKKPTKADMQRFREKKQEKKARKNAWLRE
ncbi:hypothetical protein DL93DRAFT_38343 [Clavulina sp. PMI_390]|nr:hypothetical protein DL93DRAFT_38343 [Clavulina sp. PMI_390]